MQKTRKEIVELRAKAICRANAKNIIGEDSDIGWENYTSEAQATIEADEKAGILLLVEPGSHSVIDDLILTPEHEVAYEILAGELEEGEIIIRRANVPVYNCKKSEE